ncbi:MAG: ABC transporter ATP-binding protein [Burkholderiaceae bacterium]
MNAADTVLEVRQLAVRYQTAAGPLTAVRGVSLTVDRGECVALVGESGCGKSTLGKAIVGLAPPSQGEVFYSGRPVSGLPVSTLRPLRRKVQMVFQDPQSSLNPRLTVGRIIEEPLIVHGLGADHRERIRRVHECLAQVGLEQEAAARYPHEFSGGQRQRVGIARALALSPELIVADECVAALDVSVQAQVVNLLIRLKHQLGFSLLFIAHDLSVVQMIADRVAVMYLGRIVETAPRRRFWSRPLHPYARALIDAAPVPDPRRRRTDAGRLLLDGEVPSPHAPPSGCGFHPRCPFAEARCRTDAPPLQRFADGTEVACHRVVADPLGEPVPQWAHAQIND